MAVRAAVMFVAPEVDPQQHRATVLTPAVELAAVAVNNYTEAVEVCLAMADEGFVAFELCGGFGHIGAAKVAEALAGKAAVGVVRFDNHPGLEFKSGDELFK